MHLTPGQVWTFIFVAFFAGIGATVAVQLFLLPYLKREATVVITGAADELEALIEALRNRLMVKRAQKPPRR